MIWAKADRIYSLGRIYGGIAFRAGYPYLVEKYRDGGTTERGVYKWNGTEPAAPAFYLKQTDTGAWESVFESLSFTAGTWRGYQLIVPPLVVNTPTHRKTYISQMGIWDVDGSFGTQLYTAFSALDLATGIEMSPYDSITPGIADRHYMLDHDTFFADGRGRLMAWRAGMAWNAVPRTDPAYVGQYTAIGAGVRPLEFDGPNGTERLITVDAAGHVTWWDVTGWDTAGGTMVSLVPHKVFGAFDAKSGIQDLVMDRDEDRMWILTTDGDLQRYDLQPFNDEVPQDSDPRAIRCINPIGELGHGEVTNLTFHLLDMWGVMARNSVEVEILAAATDAGGAFYGTVDGQRRVTKTSSNGLVNVLYRNKMTVPGDSGPETIMARVVS